MADKIYAVAYARFSSDMQREESIDAQVRAIKEYAEKNGYTLLKIYDDKGISGTTDQRPKFQEMIQDAKQKKFNAVIVHKLDRFARDRTLSAIYRQELYKNGVQLISVLENLDDSPESILLESIIEGYNEYYSKNLRREVMKGLRENAFSCRHTGGIPCLGYDVDHVTQKLIVNEYEAEAVRLIFKMYLENEGYTKIIDALNMKGFRTKRGAPFGKNSLYEILRNEKYTGVFIYNKTAPKNTEGKFNRHKYKSDDEIIRIEGGVPAIISKEDFDKVQRKIEERKKRTAAFAAKQEYLLSGKIVCGECGSTYAGSSRKANSTHPIYISYRCTKRNGSIKCKNPEIQRDLLEEAVLRRLSDCVFDEERLPELLKSYNEYAARRNTSLTAEIDGLKRKLTETKKGINNIVNVVVTTGSMALNEKLAELEDEKIQLQLSLDAAELKLSSTEIDAKKLKSAFRQAKKMLQNGTLKNKAAIVERYVKKVTIYKERIVIEFNIAPTFSVEHELKRE
ncbi:MAG: recombinase family protein [Clostridia bacterium]